jgi:hypothetical protein
LHANIPARVAGSSAALRCSAGYALVVALIAVLAVSLAATVAVQHHRLKAQRERELQLLWVGNQYRLALRRYAGIALPNGQPGFPRALEDLLLDKRLPTTARYLRQLYPDPFTGKADWALDMEQDRIVGVHSRSPLAPVRRAGLGPGNAGFASARSYSDWHFMANDAVEAAAVPALASQGSSPPAGDSSPTDAPPPVPPDPNAQARTQCNAQFNAPSLRCRGPDYPMGNSTLGCQREMADALAACMAAVGG